MAMLRIPPKDSPEGGEMLAGVRSIIRCCEAVNVGSNVLFFLLTVAWT